MALTQTLSTAKHIIIETRSIHASICFMFSQSPSCIFAYIYACVFKHANPSILCCCAGVRNAVHHIHKFKRHNNNTMNASGAGTQSTNEQCLYRRDQPAVSYVFGAHSYVRRRYVNAVCKCICQNERLEWAILYTSGEHHRHNHSTNAHTHTHTYVVQPRFIHLS